MQSYCSMSEKETEEIGAKIAKECSNGDFLALFGDLGSGKTAFARGFVGELIPGARVSSPTYAILSVYQGNEQTVNHFDMYRITSGEDLESTGYDEVIQTGITLCEWPEKIIDYLPGSFLKVVFEKTSETGRQILVERVSI